MRDLFVYLTVYSFRYVYVPGKLRRENNSNIRSECPLTASNNMQLASMQIVYVIFWANHGHRALVISYIFGVCRNKIFTEVYVDEPEAVSPQLGCL